MRQQRIIFLLYGRNKNTQQDDIKRALMAEFLCTTGKKSMEQWPKTHGIISLGYDYSKTRFDVADYLDSEEMIREYFRQVMEYGDTDEIIRALRDIARTRSMTQLAKDLVLDVKAFIKHSPKVPSHVLTPF